MKTEVGYIGKQFNQADLADPYIVKGLAARAYCDVRTLMKVVLGKPVRLSSQMRLRAFCEAEGMTLPPAPAPKVRKPRRRKGLDTSRLTAYWTSFDDYETRR